MNKFDKIASMLDASTVVNGMEHIRKLEAHGAMIVDTPTGCARDVDLNLYCDAMRFIRDENAISIDYNMRIPETDDAMILRIWRNGHVDSGSHDLMMSII